MDQPLFVFESLLGTNMLVLLQGAIPPADEARAESLFTITLTFSSNSIVAAPTMHKGSGLMIIDHHRMKSISETTIDDPQVKKFR